MTRQPIPQIIVMSRKQHLYLANLDPQGRNKCPLSLRYHLLNLLLLQTLLTLLINNSNFADPSLRQYHLEASHFAIEYVTRSEC